MSDDPGSPNAYRPNSAAEHLDAVRDRFEAAWKKGQRPRIEDYFQADSPSQQSAAQLQSTGGELLVALVAIDLEYRWRPTAEQPGETPIPTDMEAAEAKDPSQPSPPLPARAKLEDYVARFPTLGPLGELPLELIVEEYRVRHRWGDRPAHDAYLERFGRQRPELAEMLSRTDWELASGETIGHASPTDSAWSAVSEPPGPAPAPRRRLGDYELQQRLGHGGMGVVYRARHVLLNQIVALKVLPEKLLAEPQAVSRFRREMQLIGGLNHPNIVRAHNAGEHGGVHYLVMEYVDGITLQQLISRRREPLPVGAACELIRQAALGLQHAHQHGLVHRDVKPANLMLDAGGTLKILDLGLARLRADRPSPLELNQPGVSEHGVFEKSEPGIAIGTVDYMAPEQWEDSSAVDIRADIYSLGCTLFCLLAGRAPYAEQSYDTIRKKLKAHAAEPIPSILEQRNDCPKELDRLLKCMLAKEADDRFDTPAEAAEAISQFADFDALREVLSDGGGGASGEQSDVAGEALPAVSGVETWESRRRPSSPVPRPKPSYRRLGVMAAAVLTVAIIAGVLWWLLLWPPGPSAWQRQVRAEVGSLPGLNGGWWFDETPWFVPAIRARLIEAIDAGQREIAGVSLESLAVAVRGSDVDALYTQLRKISRQLKQRIPDDKERKFVADVQILLFDREQMSLQSYTEQLNVAKETIDQIRNGDGPTALHFKAVVQHELARYKLAQWSAAQASYEAALAKYKESEEDSAKILHALCLADYSQMLFDSRQYKDSASYFQDARRDCDAPALVVATLCREADASRKLQPIPNMTHAVHCLDEARDNRDLPEDHPLRAHTLERRAWVQMDSWQFSRAIESFRQSLKIRAAHEEPATAQTTRDALWSRQGVAMALHFRGEKQSVIDEYDRLIADVPDAATTANYAQRRKSQRGPNVRECYADWFLFGTEPDWPRAAALLHEGIQQTEYLHFEDDYRAPYVLRLRYKLMLARALASQLSEDEPKAEASPAAAAPSGNDDKDREIFAEAQEVAHAVIRLKQALGQGDRTGVKPLFEKIAKAKPDTQLARNKLGLLVLAIEQVCDSQMLEPAELKVVARQLVEIARVTSLGKDPGVKRFLRRYLEAVREELQRVGETSAGVDLARERELIEEWLR